MFMPVKITALPEYKLRIVYDDGVSGVVDLSHLVGQGVFQLWNDPSEFHDVSIGPSGEIRWSDAVDICPDAIYMEVSGKSPEEVFPNLVKETIDAGS